MPSPRGGSLSLGLIAACGLLLAGLVGCASGTSALSVRDACKEINRKTFIVLPANSSLTDSDIKAAGRPDRVLAQRVADRPFRLELLATAKLAFSQTWGPGNGWFDAPAV